MIKKDLMNEFYKWCYQASYAACSVVNIDETIMAEISGFK